MIYSLMWHGIKPTRLWHLTGKKHFNNMLNARFTANPDRCYNQREREDLFMLCGIMLTALLGTAYAFGAFSPPRDCNKKKDEELKDTTSCNSDPCPPVKTFKRPKPCPPRAW